MGEEVPLNTGETIWVKREVVYALKGGAGNPLDIKYRPDWTQTFSFYWQGRRYSYTGVAAVMLVAISPNTKQPVLVAPAANKDWDRGTGYRCTTPFYVQLVPDASGSKWSWPPRIEPWLYGMSYNLMRHIPKLEDVRPRYSVQDRSMRDSGFLADKQTLNLVRIEQDYQSESCKK